MPLDYEDRIVCFIDILGFASQVRRTLTQGKSDLKRIEAIAEAFTRIRHLLDIDSPEADRGRLVTQFSDSIVISFPKGQRSELFYTLNDLLHIQIALAYRGMLCRGALVEGKLIHTNQIVFGPALVEAYELESKAAVFPRIILSDELIDVARTAHAVHHRPADEIAAIRTMLKRDTDGMSYIDYVTGAQGELDDPDFDYPSYLSKLCEIVRHGQAASDASVRVKHQWIREKLVPHIQAIKAHLQNVADDDDLKQAYDDLPAL